MFHYFVLSLTPTYCKKLNFSQADDPYFNKLIRILATRCMTQVTLLEWLSEVEILLKDTFLHVFIYLLFA